MYNLFLALKAALYSLKSYILLIMIVVFVKLNAQTFTAGVPLSSPSSSGILNPYPNNITVSGIGDISSVSVTLIGVTHTYSGDLEVLLVGPTGASSILMSDVGLGNDFLNDTIIFQTGGAPFAVTSGTYAPIGSDFNGGAPAPSGPYSADLSVFEFTNADGIWSLYVNDDGIGDSGGISDWSLSFTSIIPKDTTVIISCDNYITPWNDTIYQSSFRFDTIRDINGLDSFYNVYDITINNYLNPILSVSGPECSPNPSFNFTATSSNPNISTFRWYNQAVGGSLLNTGPNYVASFNATSSVFVSQGGQLAPFPAQTSLNIGANTGGYWFVAPNAFIITSLFVPTIDSNKFQNVAVVKMDGNIPPPTASLSTNDFTTLYISQVNNTRGAISVNIPVQAGEVIGILGSRESDNSYSNANNQTIINGDVIPLKPLGYPGQLTTTEPYNLSSFPLNPNISRVIFEYSSSNVCINPARTEVTAIVHPSFLTVIDTAVCDSFEISTGDRFYFTQTVYDTLSSFYTCDSVIQYNLTVNQSTFASITALACDSFIAPSGAVYYADSVFTDTSYYASGCPNIKVIDLIVGYSSIDTTSIIVCDQFTTPSGTVLTSDTLFVDNLQSVNFCDSIVCFDVKVNLSKYTFDTIVSCDSYTSLSGAVYDTSAVYFDSLQTSLGCDSLVEVVLIINYSTIDSLVEVHCDSYVSPNGSIRTASAIFYDTLSTVNNCDSLIYIDLTINNSSTESLLVTQCDSYVSPAGDTYTSSATFADTLQTISGCDSIINIDLIINNSVQEDLILEVCDTFVSPLGNGYNSSSIFTEVYTSALGCDSTVTFFLLVNKKTMEDIDILACDSFTSPAGIVFTSSAVFSDTLINVNSCDSILNINLTIVNSSFAVVNETACDSYTSPLGDLYTSSQTIFDTLQSVFGCDSVLQIELVMNQSVFDTVNATTCNEYTSGGLVNYDSSGVYMESYVTADGCDSTVTIVLEVDPLILTVNKEDNILESLDFEATYQWINCTTGAIVAGETGRVYAASTNESYAVIVDNTWCIDTSECVMINSINTGIFWIENIEIDLYPNPARDLMILSSSENLDNLQYQIVDLKGSKVGEGVLSGKLNRIAIGYLDQGMYFIQVENQSMPLLKLDF